MMDPGIEQITAWAAGWQCYIIVVLHVMISTSNIMLYIVLYYIHHTGYYNILLISYCIL